MNFHRQPPEDQRDYGEYSGRWKVRPVNRNAHPISEHEAERIVEAREWEAGHRSTHPEDER